MVDVVVHHRRYFDIVVRLVLDPEANDITFDYPVAATVARTVTDDTERTDTVDAIAALMGWLAFEPFVAGAARIPKATQPETATRLERLASILFP